MNSNKIESIEITTLNNKINKHNNLQENFSTRNKKSIWDGNIYALQKIKEQVAVG